jgi:bacterioferritin-associated ferredoxin
MCPPVFHASFDRLVFGVAEFYGDDFVLPLRTLAPIRRRSGLRSGLTREALPFNMHDNENHYQNALEIFSEGAMIVCECLALTEGQVLKKLEGGACRLSDLVPKSALEGSCGACFQQLKKMIREHRDSEKACSSLSPSETLPVMTT